MFDTIKRLFTDERAEFFAERDQLDADFKERDAAFDSEIERLETRPIASLRDRAETEKQLQWVKDQKDRARVNYRIKRDQIEARLRASVPAIDENIHRLFNEIELTQKQLSISGALERINSIAPPKAYLDTNADKIRGRVEALRTAIKDLEALKLKPVSDVYSEIAGIVASVPALDVATERVECGLAIAGSLQYPSSNGVRA